MQHVCIAVTFACWNFLLILSLKRIKNSIGRMQQLYTYDANESTLIFHSDLCQGWWGKLTREGKGLTSPIFQCQDKPTF